MREIKFKIYDKELKESHIERLQDLCEDDYWYDGKTDVWSVLYDSHNEQERFVALQYTGLKDKNGTEIYEGDIILTQPYRDKPFSSKAKEKRLKGIVFYNIKCGKNFVHDPDILKYWGAEWNIEIMDKEAYKKYSYCSWGSFFECEVIGNIYDNPELLKEAKI